MKKQNTLLAIIALSAIGLASAMPTPIPLPPLSLSLGLTFQTIKNNTTCYSKVNQPVYASGGSQVMITNGECQTTNTNVMGKAGDLSRFNLKGLKTVDLGTVTENEGAIVSLPAPGERNAVVVTFTPSNPMGSKIVPSSQLRGRKVQALLVTRPLTKALAASEAADWIEGQDQLLLELWGRTYPSVKGTDDFQQFFNIAVLASEVGSQFTFKATPEGSVELLFRTNYNGTDAIAGPATNITSQKP